MKIINFNRKKIKSLTKAHEESYKNAKICKYYVSICEVFVKTKLKIKI